MPENEQTRSFRELRPGDVFIWNDQKFQKLPLVRRFGDYIPDNAIGLDTRRFAFFGGRVQVKFIEHLELETA